MFPTDDILDFIDHKNSFLAEGFYQRLIKGIGVFGQETKKAFIFKVKVIKRVFTQMVGDLRQKC